MRLIGLMSGTSVDGIDAAVVTFTGKGTRLRWQAEAFVCVPWPDALRNAILDTCRADAPLQMVTALNVRVGEAFAEAAKTATNAAGVELSDVDAIASHGQTIWHQPEPFAVGDGEARGTMQIGEPSVIAARTGCVVVADFRSADMALGGQGAPLVPFADWMLFRSGRESRALLNIGGIANITYLPKGGTLDDVIAFDIGPGNMLLDALTRRVTNGVQKFDEDGLLAKGGVFDSGLAQVLLDHAYFARRPPKSTGREEFGEPFAEWFIQKARERGLQERDWLATATAFVARTISDAIRDLLPAGKTRAILVSGGGIHNQDLMWWLNKLLGTVRIRACADYGLNDDSKEAVAFALLGYETLHGRPSNVPNATGASGPAVLGKIILPPAGTGKLRLRLDKPRRGTA